MGHNRSEDVDSMTLEEIEAEINSLQYELQMQYYDLGKSLYDYVDGAIREIGSTVDCLVTLKKKHQQLMEIKTDM